MNNYDDSIIVRCLNCGQKNRLKKYNKHVLYKCGKCGSYIKNPFIEDSYKQNSINFIIVKCLNCGQNNRVKKLNNIGFYKCGKCKKYINNPFFKIKYPYIEFNLEQNTPEWEEWRKRGFGASDIPVLMGENPRKSIKKLIEEKKGNVKDFQNSAMHKGKMLKPEARKKFIEKVGFKFFPLCIQHKKYPWARASLDGISLDRKYVVEIKCGDSAYKKALNGEIPKYYYGQLQHILFVTGLDIIYYWCYLPDKLGILLTEKRNEAYIKKIISKGEKYKCFL